MKRVFTLLLSVVMLATLLSSCRSTEYVMKYQDKKISVNYYTYWLSSYKARLMYYYSDIQDSEEFWNSEYAQGVTIDSFLTSNVDDYVKRYLIADYLCDYYKISLTDSAVSSIDDQLAQILEDVGSGSVSKFNSVASEYGVNYKMLRNIYIMEAKAEMVYDYIIENQIKSTITDAVIEDYYQNNYCRLKHIYISTQFSTNYDENGDPVYDADGNYTKDYTDEEKAAQIAKAAQLEAVITPQNFADYVDTYNEDPAVKNYTNGFYLSAATDYDSNIIKAGLTMNVGEVQKVETDYGIYFIYKCELDQGAWANNANSDFFGDIYSDVSDKLYNDLISGYYSDVQINEEVKEGISIKTVSPCNYF